MLVHVLTLLFGCVFCGFHLAYILVFHKFLCIYIYIFFFLHLFIFINLTFLV